MSGAVIEIIQAKGKNADREEAPVVVARAIYEHPFMVRLCHWLNTVALFVMVGSGLQIFRAFPELWRQDSAERFAALAESVRYWRLAGRGAAVASHLHVDLHRDRALLFRLPTFQRQLPAGFVYASRYSGRVADGSTLFFLWSEAAGSRSLQPSAEAGLHRGDRAGGALGSDRARGVEAGAVFLAGLDDGRIPLCAHLAFCGDVGDFVFCAGTSGDGDFAWMEQFRFHDHGLEERSGVLMERVLGLRCSENLRPKI